MTTLDLKIVAIFCWIRVEFALNSFSIVRNATYRTSLLIYEMSKVRHEDTQRIITFSFTNTQTFTKIYTLFA